MTFRLLREALYRLSLEPDEQRRSLPDFVVVTDELADDLHNAVLSLAHAQDTAGIRLSPEVISELTSLNTMFDLPSDDAIWDDHALDRHPTWAEARRVARQLLPLLPGQHE